MPWALAVPSVVSKPNVTFCVLGFESETVNVARLVPGLPSGKKRMLPMLTVGSGSVSWIVALAVIVALTGDVTRTWKSSFGSSMSSGRTSTRMVPVVAPAGMTSVPVGTSAKSRVVAPPGTVFQLTVVGKVLAFDSVTRNEAVAVAVPSGSSTMPASATDTTTGSASSSTMMLTAVLPPIDAPLAASSWRPNASLPS